MVNPLMPKKLPPTKFKKTTGSAGILDDYAVRKNVATREGTIEKVAVNDSDIINKKYFTTNYKLSDGTAAGVMCFWDGTGWVPTATSEMFWDDTNKRLGIGTATPTQKLDVNGNIGIDNYIYNRDATENFLKIGSNLIELQAGNTGSFKMSNWQFIVNDGGTDMNTQFKTVASDNSLFIDGGNGRVGIGTSSPSYPLDVNGRITADQLSLGTNGATSVPLFISTTNNPAVQISTAGVTNVNMSGTNIGLIWNDISGYDSWRFFVNGGQFGIRNQDDAANVVELKDGSSANSITTTATGVGILNATPTAALDVTGDIVVSGLVDGIDIFTDVTANNAKITNATHTGEVTGSGALTIADNVVDEANLKLDEAPTNDYVLTADSTKSGGMKWAAASSGSPTKEFIVHAQENPADDGPVGYMETTNLVSSESNYFTFHVPHDFTSLIEAKLLIIPDATETVQWDCEAEWASVGEEVGDNLGEAMTNETDSVVSNVLYELDVTQTFNGTPQVGSALAANDHVGLKFTSDTTQIRMCYLRFKYS